MSEGIHTKASQISLFWTCAVWCSTSMVVLIFLVIVGDVVCRGMGSLDLNFLVESPKQSGRAGGILPMMISTGAILLVCLSTAVPLGIATAMFLNEFARRDGFFGGAIHLSLDVLAGVPSIVFGLFGNAFFAITLGLGFSILSGGLTLACMALPLIIRSTEAGFHAIPDSQRMTAASLGLSQSSILFRILLPAAWPGILVGVVLGIGRALAETAALIFTSGYVTRMPESFFDSGRSLSVHIYDLAMNVPGGEPNAYTSALVLIGLILLANLSAGTMLKFWLTRHQASRSISRRRLV